MNQLTRLASGSMGMKSTTVAPGLKMDRKCHICNTRKTRAVKGGCSWTSLVSIDQVRYCWYSLARLLHVTTIYGFS